MIDGGADSTAPGVSLSLCIGTLERPSELARCLESLHAGTRLPDEILVSDDSPDPEPTRAVCSQYPKVRYLRGPGAGLAIKRNQLVDAARGTHILFTDDDVTFPHDFIASAHRVIRRMQPRTVVTGFTVNHWKDGHSEKVPPHNPDFWGLQRLPIEKEPRALSMNATLFPANLFGELRFDPRLIYGSEEIDLARHARALGYRIEYTEELYTDHHPPDERRDYQSVRITEGLRLFATAKAYWCYERARAKTVAYVVLASVQLVVGALRRHCLREALAAIALAGRLTAAAAVRRITRWRVLAPARSKTTQPRGCGSYH
jgi:GT2 family glycosyltransferase